MAVVALRRLSVFKHHARRHRISALNVGIVEALNVARQLRQPEILLHPRQQTRDPLLRIKLLGILHLVVLILARVLQRNLKQTPFVAPLRHHKRAALRSAVGQERHNNRPRRIVELSLRLGNSIRQNLLRRLVELLTELKRHTLHHRAMAHVHIIDVSEIVARLIRIDIDVGFRRAHDDRLRPVAFNQLIFPLQLLRLLKPQLGGKPLHLRHKVVGNRLRVTAQNALHLTDIFPVFLRRHPALAAPQTIVDVIVKTDAHRPLLHAFSRNRPAARPQRIKLLQKLEQRAHHRGARIRAIITSALRHNVAREKHTRIQLVCDAYPRIRLVVLQQDVVARLILLDKTVFKMQGIVLAAHHNVAHISDVAHQHVCLHRVVYTVEIRRHTPFQPLRLAYIYNRPHLVVVEITSRLVGQHTDFIFQDIVHRSIQ